MVNQTQKCTGRGGVGSGSSATEAGGAANGRNTGFGVGRVAGEEI